MSTAERLKEIAAQLDVVAELSLGDAARAFFEGQAAGVRLAIEIIDAEVVPDPSPAGSPSQQSASR